MKFCGSLSLIALLVFGVVGCTGVARMSDFSRSAENFDFDDLSKQIYEHDRAGWNQQTKYEYYIEAEKIDEKELFIAISEALKRLDYVITFSDKHTRTVIGERGMQWNEWNSITGVYYKYKKGIYQIYFKNAITQDFTGGWKQNRAKNVVYVLCNELIACKK